MVVEGRASAERDRIEEQLADLMDRYEGPLRSFLLVLLSNREIACDCAQDTFVRAYENLCKGKPVNAQWLYKVARNRAMDEFRQRRRVQTTSIEGLERQPLNDPDEPARTAAVRRALERLSPEDREVLYLYVFDRFKTAEIAAMLGVRAGTARMRLLRARERFRVLYGDAL